MKLLVVEPLALTGHINSNQFFVKRFAEFSKVTLATYQSYHRHFSVDRTVSIGDALRPEGGSLRTRWLLARVLYKIRRSVDLDSFDATIFLCYEGLSLLLAWPRTHPTFVFEHNNPDGAEGSSIKALTYQLLPPAISHLTYFPHVSRHLERRYGRHAATIPRPYHVSYQASRNEVGPPSEGQQRILFAPSSGNRPDIVADLTRFAMENSNWRLLIKGNKPLAGHNFRVQAFFEDYHSHMARCHAVFFGGLYKYRGSGVIWEGLNYCKPVFMLDSGLARAMKRMYPGAIHVIDSVHNLNLQDVDYAALHQDHLRFLELHSAENISGRLATELKERIQIRE